MDGYKDMDLNESEPSLREEQIENIDKVFKNIMKQITIDKKINYYI